jgi:hypothetical protein
LQAYDLNGSLAVFSGIANRCPEANEPRWRFVLRGRRETGSSLADREIEMVVWHRLAEQGAVELSVRAAVVAVDRGDLGIQKEWRSGAEPGVRGAFVD